MTHPQYEYDAQYLFLLHTHTHRRGPKLYLQVSSLNSWNRHSVEGYTYLDLPLKAGCHDFTLSCWKPCRSLRTRLKEFFVGGTGVLHEMQFVNQVIIHGALVCLRMGDYLYIYIWTLHIYLYSIYIYIQFRGLKSSILFHLPPMPLMSSRCPIAKVHTRNQDSSPKKRGMSVCVPK